MANLLSIFGFGEEKNDENDKSVKNEEIVKIPKKRGRKPAARVEQTGEDQPAEQNQGRKPRKRKLRKNSNEQISSPSARRKYHRRQTRELDDDGEIRRSKRMHKPKSHFSPGKNPDLDCSGRKRRTTEGAAGISKMKKRGRPKGRRSMPESEKKNEESDKTGELKKQESSSSSDCSEDSEDFDENDAENCEDEEEEETSSSSCEDSEDEYKPASNRKSTSKRRSHGVVVDQAPTSTKNDKITPRRRGRPPKARDTMLKKNDTLNFTNDEDVLARIESGELPETVLYRPEHNRMYIPSIHVDMIAGIGENASIQPKTKDYFKFQRISRNERAEIEKVREILDAVRRRPIIWDQRLACHHNITLVRRAWINLDFELGVCDDYPLGRRKQIWKSRKDYYSLANGKKWIFSRDMEFYAPMLKFRPVFKNEVNALEKSVLSNSKITCNENDKINVLTFLLKSIHDVGMANLNHMVSYQSEMLRIFRSNFEKISRKYAKPVEIVECSSRT